MACNPLYFTGPDLQRLQEDSGSSADEYEEHGGMVGDGIPTTAHPKPEHNSSSSTGNVEDASSPTSGEQTSAVNPDADGPAIPEDGGHIPPRKEDGDYAEPVPYRASLDSERTSHLTGSQASGTLPPAPSGPAPGKPAAAEKEERTTVDDDANYPVSKGPLHPPPTRPVPDATPAVTSTPPPKPARAEQGATSAPPAEDKSKHFSVTDDVFDVDSSTAGDKSYGTCAIAEDKGRRDGNDGGMLVWTGWFKPLHVLIAAAVMIGVIILVSILATTLKRSTSSSNLQPVSTTGKFHFTTQTIVHTTQVKVNLALDDNVFSDNNGLSDGTTYSANVAATPESGTQQERDVMPRPTPTPKPT